MEKSSPHRGNIGSTPCRGGGLVSASVARIQKKAESQRNMGGQVML